MAEAVSTASRTGRTALETPVLYLKKNEERRLRAGHNWIYSNEIDTGRTPLKGLPPGAIVRVMNHREQAMGTGYANPGSLISVRMLSSKTDLAVDREFLARRMSRALEMRDALIGRRWFRWVYGESDGLPGLVIDLYGTHCVVQINTAGMEALREDIVAAIRSVIDPESILLKCDGRSRKLEELEPYVEQAHGVTPEEVPLQEGALDCMVPVRGGQKTGWFYDQRINRETVARYAQGRTVLDVFSYLGGFGLAAAAAGASSVTCVDQSAQALEYVKRNAARMGHAEKVGVEQGDAFTLLKDLAERGAKYDFIVLDPPALVQRKKDLKEGEQAYFRLNRMALDLLPPGGLLFTASCSHHFSRSNLLDAVRRAGLKAKRQVRVIGAGGQGPDHPVHPSMAETEYLKALLVQA